MARMQTLVDRFELATPASLPAPAPKPLALSAKAAPPVHLAPPTEPRASAGTEVDTFLARLTPSESRSRARFWCSEE